VQRGKLAAYGGTSIKTSREFHKPEMPRDGQQGKADALIRELVSLTSGKHESAVEGDSASFVAFQADMSSKDDVRTLVNNVQGKMGRLYVVVSNAGWTKMRNFMDLDDNMDEGDWDRCFAVNVKSHL
jgi:NAD(P)-dependent dehydrogenase (short-subunit alcohol dehydrogenase family)